LLCTRKATAEERARPAAVPSQREAVRYTLDVLSRTP